MSQAVENLDTVQRAAASHRSSAAVMIVALFLSAALSGCSGSKGTTTPSNVGGGYTLKASGGTLNDGSGTKGLVVLATLRDSQGWGPSFPWTITITGPGISSSSPLILEYSDSRPRSFMSWEWAGFLPSSGTYRAVATNGTTTIYQDFTVSNTAFINRPLPSVSSPGGSYTISWAGIPGAASYSYEVYYPSGGISVFDYTNSTNVDLGTLTVNGDYLVRIRCYATDRVAVAGSEARSPVLASQENVSEYSFTFPVGGDQTSANYNFSASGGVLDFGLRRSGGMPIYGLAVWTTVQKGSAGPEGNWNIKVTDPNGLVLNYLYPATKRHHAYWYYGIEPVAGTYNVEATYGLAKKTSSFTIATVAPLTARLTPLNTTQISALLNAGTGDITLNWAAVTGAKSYYVNLWAELWNAATKQYEYREVWRVWVKDSGTATTSTVITKATSGIAPGSACDVYVTGHEVDMTAVAPPVSMPLRADMSENYFGYALPFRTP